MARFPDSQVVWDPSVLDYRFSHSHPMDPVRLRLTMELSRMLGVLDGAGELARLLEGHDAEQLAAAVSVQNSQGKLSAKVDEAVVTVQRDLHGLGFIRGGEGFAVHLVQLSVHQLLQPAGLT